MFWPIATTAMEKVSKVICATNPYNEPKHKSPWKRFPRLNSKSLRYRIRQNFRGRKLLRLQDETRFA